MGAALNSVFGSSGLGGLVSSALDVAGAVFPPLGIASSLTNLVTSAVGSALSDATSALSQVAGMPKFIGQEVNSVIKDVVSELTQQTDPDCDAHVGQQCGSQVNDFASQFAKSFSDYAVQNMGGSGSSSKSGGGSWFEALAKALGQALDKQAATVKADSAAVTGENATDDPSGMTKLQTDSQKMSFMMSAVDQVVKTIGEALGTIARKQ